VGHVNDTDKPPIRPTSWQVDVLDRLCGVREDVRRAISAAGWTLTADATPKICPQSAAPGQSTQGATTQDDASIRLVNEAQAVVDTTYQYIGKTQETIELLSKRRQRFRDLLTGDGLMSAYVNLHAAESTRMLLLSSDQLAAILPSIRKRATAFLPADDPNFEALKTIPDPTQPAHQAVAARVQTGPATGQAQVPGNQHGSQGQQPSSDNTVSQTAPSGAIVLTDILGADQQVAAQVMSAACRAEDQQQLQVRHFRGVLYGASAALLVVVAVLWIVGSIHPAYFPLCWPVSGSHPAMICPTGGSKPTGADVPLVLGVGALGAALSVALNLAGLKPAGVRFSLTVAQGLNKIVLGAIIAVLGIIVLRTVTNAPGFLGTQPGLLTTAVVFGYSQQVFTRLIDRQASQLTNAASPATPAAHLSASPERKPLTSRTIAFLLRLRARVAKLR